MRANADMVFFYEYQTPTASPATIPHAAASNQRSLIADGNAYRPRTMPGVFVMPTGTRSCSLE